MIHFIFTELASVEVKQLRRYLFEPVSQATGFVILDCHHGHPDSWDDTQNLL